MRHTIKSFLLLVFALTLTSVHALAKDGIAIVIDPISQSKAANELNAFIKALEQRQHYKVYTVTDRWNMPDSIRTELMRLHSLRHDPIVGAILIGDIPIPMIRDAQYLTSAFKMDQKNPRKESSVPSDRFYDDFGLSFRYLDKDEDAPYFYYTLTSEGRQYLSPDIFSGRIRPTDTEESSRYDKLKDYLRKATEAKNHPEKFCSISIFTGCGSISESKPAHIDEFRGLMEHFPQLSATPQAFRYIDYSDEKPIRYKLMNELSKPDLSLAVLHHHGDWDTQYLGISDNDNLTLADIRQNNFRPNVRIAIFDACFNGSFHREDCIANEYIFRPGKTIATIGGTVNLIQDKWYDRYIGLLATGTPVGYINQHSVYLESHVIGDPTFTFADASVNGEKPAADMICLRMEENSKSYSDNKLIDILRTNPYATVRLQAFTMLRDRHSSKLTDATVIALQDNYEMLQRFAVNTMRAIGSPRLIPSLAQILTNTNASKRVAFNASQSIQFFDKDLLKASVDSILEKQSTWMVQPDSFRTSVMGVIKKYGGTWDDEIKDLLSGKMDKKHALRQTDYMRIYCPAYFLREVADYTMRCDDHELQKALLDVLGWHDLAYCSDHCASVALKMSDNPSLPSDVRDAAMKTYKRIKRK